MSSGSSRHLSSVFDIPNVQLLRSVLEPGYPSLKLPLLLYMFLDKFHNCFFLQKMRIRTISTPTLQGCCETKFWINVCQQILCCPCSLLFLQCQVQCLKEGIQQTSANSLHEWIYQMVITTILRHFILGLLNFKFLATATSWNPSKGWHSFKEKRNMQEYSWKKLLLKTRAHRQNPVLKSMSTWFRQKIKIWNIGFNSNCELYIIQHKLKHKYITSSLSLDYCKMRTDWSREP